jgi:hypothetical protein
LADPAVRTVGVAGMAVVGLRGCSWAGRSLLHLGTEVRVVGGQQVLAVQLGLGVDLRTVDDEPAVGLLSQVAAEDRVVA